MFSPTPTHSQGQSSSSAQSRASSTQASKSSTGGTVGVGVQHQSGQPQQWLSSPFSQLEALSPESTISFTITSPCRYSSAVTGMGSIPGIGDDLGIVGVDGDGGFQVTESDATPLKNPGDVSSLFSPSLFSPYGARQNRNVNKRKSAMHMKGMTIMDADEEFAAADGTMESHHHNSNNMNGGDDGDIHQRMHHYDGTNLIRHHELFNGEDGSTLHPGISLMHEGSPESKFGNISVGSSNSLGGGGQGSLHLNGSSMKRLHSQSPFVFSSPAADALARAIAPANMSPPIIGESKNQCNCKKSKCLKLYCECFAALKYCSGCNCIDCYNSADTESNRQEAIRATKERNPAAFKTKVMKVNDEERHSTGCNCKKSQCLKKYCECFEGAVFCADHCKCKSCQNYDGSEALDAAKLSKDKKGAHSAIVRMPMPSMNGAMTMTIGGSPSDQDGLSVADYTGGRYTENVPCITQNYQMRMMMMMQKRAVFGGNNFYQVGSEGSSGGDGGAMMHLANNMSIARPLKKRKVKLADRDQPKYHFFGENHPPLTKLIALRCIEFLETRDLYPLSLVNRLFSHLAVDKAIWDFGPESNYDDEGTEVGVSDSDGDDVDVDIDDADNSADDDEGSVEGDYLKIADDCDKVEDASPLDSTQSLTAIERIGVQTRRKTIAQY